jgi:hypothetical protein
MGHHYLPQYYLKGFSDDDGMIWVYEKGSEKKFNTQVKSAANITNLYSADLEQYMADNIEGPANIVLEKIRNKVPVEDNDKEVLSGYIIAIWKRVPKALERFKESAPRVGNEMYKKICDDLTVMASREPDKAEFVEKNKERIRAIIDDLADDPPKDLWQYNIPPEKTPQSVAALNRMNWQFLVINDRDREIFLTCDNPVFFFQSIGIGNRESELTFPLSSKIALWATWRDDLPEYYVQATKQAIREINRRTVSNASRYVFHSKDEDWIKNLITKRTWQLHRLL